MYIYIYICIYIYIYAGVLLTYVSSKIAHMHSKKQCAKITKNTNIRQ